MSVHDFFFFFFFFFFFLFFPNLSQLHFVLSPLLAGGCGVQGTARPLCRHGHDWHHVVTETVSAVIPHHHLVHGDDPEQHNLIGLILRKYEYYDRTAALLVWKRETRVLNISLQLELPGITRMQPSSSNYLF
ncbi:uncharacterized protein BO97DRAFT_412104 [Aspergillus homomorphus CBS 101889]|uniref:Uncharacterized protein n=1 Tax=Aspergillus homomorphus (strain CBS 101889) TaxID=1450537 RepID=A0A395I3Y9_ASPHC|nr:hypothetical protein BO97DRAFT_412104 [Aspergillus homomorphus CBS 101889]RAL14800.1 hypothetical protein BO97DRAFT_412104 [Aspergillus homomorphus CBS 101889]